MTQAALRCEPSPVRRPRSAHKSILLVGLRKEAIEGLVPALRSGPVEVASTSHGAGAIASIAERGYDLIVVREPLLDLSIDELLTEVSQPSSSCRNSWVQVIARPDCLAEVEGLSGPRVGVCATTDFGGLLATISRVILGVAPRLDSRLMVEVKVGLEGGSLSRCYQVANVSETGMLVRAGDAVPVGESVEIALSVPGGMRPLAMAGRVVRHTSPNELDGFAVELTEFSGAAKGVWLEYLKRELT